MRPTERLGFIALLGLSLVLAAFHPPGAARALAILALAAAAAALLSRLPGRGLSGLVRDAAPYAMMVTVFSLLQPAIEAVNAARYDAALAALDERWLGGLVRAWHGALGRPAAFTDGVYVVYASFYCLPVAVLLAIRARGGRDELELASLTVLVGFYLSFLGYFLWPAAGPRLPLAQEASLGGGAVSDAVRAFLHAAEGPTFDAFPSGHTGLALLTAHVGVRRFPRAALPIAAWAGAIVFSTVYIHVHYAVDVVGGIGLYASALALAPLARRALGLPAGAAVRRPGELS